MKLLTTKQFDRAVKDIKKKHDKALQEELVDKITKIYNRTLSESDKAHPITGKHANGLNDVHIGGDQIILYRYDVETDTLILSAKLHDIVKHSELNNRETFKEKQGFEQNFDEYIKEIKSSSNVGQYSELDFEEIDEWFTDYYNNVISQVICIDDIMISKIIDKLDHAIIFAQGYQYVGSVPIYRINELTKILNVHCKPEGIRCNLIADTEVTNPYNDPDSYKLILILMIPLEEVK